MSKIAILVIGAKAPRILGRVLTHFDDPRFRFFLHVDRKIDFAEYAQEAGNLDRMTMIKPRIAVFWGGYSMIEVELALIRAALADPAVSSLALWSDDTAPLRGPDEIFAALMAAPDRIACEVRPLVQDWYRRFYSADSHFTGYLKNDPSWRHFEAADWRHIQRLQRLVERGKKKLETVYFSRQWWALSRSSAETILSYMEQDEHLVESFRFSLFPDETFFATLFHLCFPLAKVPDVPTYADYDRWPTVPWMYGKRHELPDLKLIPDHLFIRKISPGGVQLVDNIVQGWPKHEPPVPDNEQTIDAAIEAREDGDLEKSLTIFDGVWDREARTPRLALEYSATLKKLRRYADADRILLGAIEAHPEHLMLRHIWADIPAQYFDHEEVIRRGAIYRAAFPPAQHPGAWHSLVMEFDALTEALRWPELAEKIALRQNEIVHFPHALRLGLSHATELCLTEQVRAIVQRAPSEAWAQLPPEAKGISRLKVDMVDFNRRLITAADTRIISIGQNCLPYLLGGRWGLIADRKRPEAMTPFDRGAFPRDKAAEVIADGFAAFLKRGEFAETGSYDGKRMLRHEPSGIYFFHERGEFWLQNNGERFFPHLQRMIENWRRVSAAGRRIFMFCLCGVGDLSKLLDVMEQHLLGPDAHLLIVDVLQQPHACPTGEHVTYIHLPYPNNYSWDNFNDQSTTRGVGFELEVVNSVADLLISSVPASLASSFRDQRRQLLLKHAASAASSKREQENSVAFYQALHQADPKGINDAVAYARTLRDNGKVDEAGLVLERQKQLHPGNYDVYRAWVDAGVAPFDWSEKLTRLRRLRAAFPPEVEPRSFSTLSQELKVLVEHGLWDEAVSLIQSHWKGFTSRSDLFQNALSAFIQLGHLTLARSLVDAAEPKALAEVRGNLIGYVLRRLDQAEQNREVVTQFGVQIIPLGQNAMSTMLVTRWGLQAAPRLIETSTPFELGDFLRETAADAVADDFEDLSDAERYVETSAWGGGKTLRHNTSGVAFAAYRTEHVGPAEQERFFADLKKMVLRWKQVRKSVSQIFLYIRSDNGDLTRLVAVAREKLWQPGSHLVIVDLNAEPAQLASDDFVTFLHAPLPNNYTWYHTLGSAMPTGLEYETRVLAPVVNIVEKLKNEKPISGQPPSRARLSD